MPLDSYKLILLADALANDSSIDGLEQARRRTAVNRGYYACVVLLIQRIEAGNPGRRAPAAATHEWIRRALRESNRNHLKKIKQKLGTLEELRGQADYLHDRADYTTDEVVAALDRSKRLYAEVKNVPNPKFERLPL